MHEVKAKSILSARNGMNLYRGCSHGCIYCDSRSTCYGMDHAFEDIEVKINGPELLEQALRRRRKRCMIGYRGHVRPIYASGTQPGGLPGNVWKSLNIMGSESLY